MTAQRFAGGVVVVMGASPGIGRASALRFAQEGAGVALLARGRDGPVGARREVEAQGRRARPLELDVADEDAVERPAGEVEARLGASRSSSPRMPQTRSPSRRGRRREVWATGTAVQTIVGNAIAPSPADRVLVRQMAPSRPAAGRSSPCCVAERGRG